MRKFRVEVTTSPAKGFVNAKVFDRETGELVLDEDERETACLAWLLQSVCARIKAGQSPASIVEMFLESQNFVKTGNFNLEEFNSDRKFITTIVQEAETIIQEEREQAD